MPTPEKSLSNPEVIGIVGCVGDLGSRITLQALEAGYEVLGFDLNTVEPENVTKVDGLLSRIGKLRVQRTTSIQELVRDADVVHH